MLIFFLLSRVVVIVVDMRSRRCCELRKVSFESIWRLGSAFAALCLKRIKFLKLFDELFDRQVVEDEPDDKFDILLAFCCCCCCCCLLFVLASMEARAAISKVIICLCLFKLDERMERMDELCLWWR